MCGLSGVVYDRNLKLGDLELARRLQILNAFRGWDSTGVIDHCQNAKKGAKVQFWRSMKDSSTWAATDFWSVYNSRWKTNPTTLLATHSRFATMGKVSPENCHPFQHGGILGMHNGTIRGEFENSKKFGTDSEALYYNISTKGLKYSLEEIEVLDGAYALVYLDLDSKKLKIIRNSKRTLFYWQEKVDEPIFWSSEREHLEAAIKSMHGAGYKGFIKNFDEGTLYSVPFTYNKAPFEFSTEKLIKPKWASYTYQQNFQQTPVHNTGPAANKNTTQTGTTAGSAKDTNPWSRKNIERAGHKEMTAFFKNFDLPSNKWYSDFQKKKLAEADEKTLNDPPFDPIKGPEADAETAPKKEVSGKERWFPIGPLKARWVSGPRFAGLIKCGCFSCGTVPFIAKGSLATDTKGHVDLATPPIVWLNQEDHLCMKCASQEIHKVYSDVDKALALPEDWRATLVTDMEMVMSEPSYSNYVKSSTAVN